MEETKNQIDSLIARINNVIIAKQHEEIIKMNQYRILHDYPVEYDNYKILIVNDNEILRNDYQYVEENLKDLMLLGNKIFAIKNISGDQKGLLGESLLELSNKLKILGFKDSQFPKNAILESEYSYFTLNLSRSIAFCATIPNAIISHIAFIISLPFILLYFMWMLIELGYQGRIVYANIRKNNINPCKGLSDDELEQLKEGLYLKIKAHQKHKDYTPYYIHDFLSKYEQQQQFSSAYLQSCITQAVIYNIELPDNFLYANLQKHNNGGDIKIKVFEILKLAIFLPSMCFAMIIFLCPLLGIMYYIAFIRLRNNIHQAIEAQERVEHQDADSIPIETLINNIGKVAQEMTREFNGGNIEVSNPEWINL